MAISGGLSVTKRDAGIELKTEEFSRFLREMKAQLGQHTTMQKIVDSEAGKVCEKALALTGKADTDKIKIRNKNRAVFTIDGKKWATRDWKTGKAWRVPDAVWSQIEKERLASLARHLARVGISKKSWYLLAQKLGQQIACPAYVKNAFPIPRGDANNVSVKRTEMGDKYGVTITNAMPILTYTPPGGREAFFSAMAGRINFFKNNMKRGVFDSLAATAKKYKGILVS